MTKPMTFGAAILVCALAPAPLLPRAGDDIKVAYEIQDPSVARTMPASPARPLPRRTAPR